MQGHRQIEALREVDQEYNNLRKAWLYLVEHRITGRMMNFASALWMFFDYRTRHADGRRLFADAIGLPSLLKICLAR